MQLDRKRLRSQDADLLLLQAIDASFSNTKPERIGIAVSGGGDSMALLHLFARWSWHTGHPIEAVTVNHGLRAEAEQEAAFVQAFCEELQIPHSTLHWQQWRGKGNLPAAARAARYELMADWAKSRDIGGIALGHTADDVAENFVMRLRRKAGVDGLATMRTNFERKEIKWARPLWQHSRHSLRDYLRRHSIDWVEDPTNDDPAYERTHARHVMAALAELGIDAETLGVVSNNMDMSRDALQHYTQFEAARCDVEQNGDVVIPMALHSEIQRRIVTRAIQWIAGLDYAPRTEAVRHFDLLRPDARPVTVAGCILIPEKHNIRVTRELNAVKNTKCATDQIWDNRWCLEGPHAPGLEIRALGESVKDCPDWRDLGVPRASLIASPAIFKGAELIAAPIVGHNEGWSARIVANFQSFLLSH